MGTRDKPDPVSDGLYCRIFSELAVPQERAYAILEWLTDPRGVEFFRLLKRHAEWEWSAAGDSVATHNDIAALRYRQGIRHAGLQLAEKHLDMAQSVKNPLTARACEDNGVEIVH